MKVLIVDPNPITITGIECILKNNFDDIEIDKHNTIDNIFEISKQKSFDIIICEFDLLYEKYILEELKKHQSVAKILIFSDFPEQKNAVRLVSNGASGYLHKSASVENIVQAINIISTGYIYLSQEIFHNNKGLNGFNKNSTPFHKLSIRELEVLKHLLNGKRPKDIKELMGIHQSTVSTLKKRIFHKTNVTSLISLKNLSDECGFEY